MLVPLREEEEGSPFSVCVLLQQPHGLVAERLEGEGAAGGKLRLDLVEPVGMDESGRSRKGTCVNVEKNAAFTALRAMHLHRVCGAHQRSSVDRGAKVWCKLMLPYSPVERAYASTRRTGLMQHN